MPLNPSLYLEFARGVKGPSDYARENADIEGLRQRNALQGLAIQQGQRANAEADRVAGEQAGARNALAAMAPGATYQQRADALRAQGTQTGYAMADALDKAGLERDKTASDIASKRSEAQTRDYALQRKRREHVLGGLSQFNQPEDAVDWLTQSVVDGKLGMREVTDMIRRMEKDPAKFPAWRDQTIMALQSPEDQAGFVRPDANAVLGAKTSAANTAATNARQAADAAAGRAVTMRGQDKTDARQREATAATRDNTAAIRGEKAAERKAAAEEKAVTKFATDLQKDNIPEIEAAIQGAEAIFAWYTKDGKLGDVPGVGRVTNTLPDWAVSSEGADVRESLSALANIVLSARSGAAVTDQELRRLTRELSLSAGRSAEDAQRAFAKFRARFEKVKENLGAGVSDEVKAEYESRGGIRIPRKNSGGAPASTPPSGAPGTPADGVKFLGFE